MWIELLREQGWTTGYVTDNPHILASVHDEFRGKFDRADTVYGQVPLRTAAQAQRLAGGAAQVHCRRRCAARWPRRA